MSYIYNDTSPTKIRALKIIASITVIGLNIPTFDVSGWWLILTEPLTFFTIVFSVEKNRFQYGPLTWMQYGKLGCMSNRVRIWLTGTRIQGGYLEECCCRLRIWLTGTWILFGLLIAIFISILTLIAQWIVLIEVIVYTITYLYLNRLSSQ